MKLSEISNNKIILVDSLDFLIKNKISTKNCLILTLIDGGSLNRNLNFYNLIDFKIHNKFNNLSKKISEEFHDNLKLDIALKKNVTRIFYGLIGLYPYYYVINELIKNKNSIDVYTEDEKIFNIFAITKNKKKLNIFYKKKTILSSFFKISKFELLKMYSIEEIFFYFKKKFFPKFKKFKNLKSDVFVHLSTEANFLCLDKFFNSKWQSKMLEIDLKKIEELKDKDLEKLNNIFKIIELFLNKYFDRNEYFKEKINFEIKNFYLRYVNFYKKVSHVFHSLNSNFLFYY